MLTFDQFVNQRLAAPPRTATSANLPAPVLDSLKQAGLLPSSVSESPSLAEFCLSLIDKNAEMHRALVADPASRRSEKLISYQVLISGFLTMLALLWDSTKPQENRS